MGSVLPCCSQQTKESPQQTMRPPPAINPPKGSQGEDNSPSPPVLPTKPSKDSRTKDIFPNHRQNKYLGEGSNGKVVLMEETDTGKRFALKIIHKDSIQEHNLLESSILSEIRNNPFLTNIVEVKQSGENIYIVMEYLPKGDLYFYTEKEGVELSDQTMKGVLAEIIVGLRYLHEKGIVYRCLKPENILITDEGHIKLTDYSMSKEKTRKSGISTFKGAIQYMAPQIIKGSFGQKADIWALGIVAYELKFRENPIEDHGKVLYSFGEYEELLKNNFIAQKINSKIGHMSQQFRELLKRLLEQDDSSRISMDELESHPFFESVDWNAVRRRTNNPPLSELIRCNNHIKFRDPSEQSKRTSVTKRHKDKDESFHFSLLEVKSQV